MANIMNIFPGGGAAEVMSGTATYVSSAAGMSISNVPRIPQMVLCTFLSTSITYGVMFYLSGWDGTQYTNKIGWDWSGSAAPTNITPLFVSYTNKTLTVKSGGSRAINGNTWNYELAF